MKISKREGILGLVTLAAVLFTVTVWLADSRLAEQRRMRDDKERLLREIKLHQRILAEKDNWAVRLQELQKQVPVYSEKSSVSSEMLKLISSMANGHSLDLIRTQPYREEQVGSLYELGVNCDWEGTLDSLVRFLYDLQQQGLRFDVRQLTAQPHAQRDQILKGSMTIDCAYRKEPAAQTPAPAP
jgi:hypothetical protein